MIHIKVNKLSIWKCMTCTTVTKFYSVRKQLYCSLFVCFTKRETIIKYYINDFESDSHCSLSIHYTATSQRIAVSHLYIGKIAFSLNWEFTTAVSLSLPLSQPRSLSFYSPPRVLYNDIRNTRNRWWKISNNGTCGRWRSSRRGNWPCAEADIRLSGFLRYARLPKRTPSM